MVNITNILSSISNIQEIIGKMNLALFQAKREILKQEWIYRGEGNANIVISLPASRQILRIRKTDKPKTFLEWFVDWIINFLSWDYKNEINNEWKDLSFYTKVMVPLLGKFVCEATPVYMSRKQINDLNKAIIQSRPDFRKHRKLQFGRATVFTDYAFLPKFMDTYKLTGATYAVEIKPKQGWMPLPSRQYSKCQFCQNQYLKLEKGQIKTISAYCPLDLFSGCKERIIKAIKSLIYNPQNNFKMFRNGIYTYGDNISVDVFYELIREWLQTNEEKSTYGLLEDFCDLIYTALTKQINCRVKDHECVGESRGGRSVAAANATEKSMMPQCNERNSAKSCTHAESVLPEGCILESILSIQKFDQLGLERYECLRQGVAEASDWGYVDKLIKEIYCDPDGFKCPRCVIVRHVDRNRCCDNSKKKSNCTELDLMPYLIASVVNDCSLMITCRRLRESDCAAVPREHVLKTRAGSFALNIGVFDLYPKPISTIDKHVRRKAKIQRTCRTDCF